MRLQLQIT